MQNTHNPKQTNLFPVSSLLALDWYIWITLAFLSKLLEHHCVEVFYWLWNNSEKGIPRKETRMSKGNCYEQELFKKQESLVFDTWHLGMAGGLEK